MFWHSRKLNEMVGRKWDCVQWLVHVCTTVWRGVEDSTHSRTCDVTHALTQQAASSCYYSASSLVFVLACH